MAKKKRSTGTISNRRARFEYDLGDSFVAGLELTGAETKALRKHQGNLKGAFVTVKDNELWLTNATITGDAAARVPEEEHNRARKLLMKRKEIDALISAKHQGQNIVPLEILSRGRFIKLRISLGKGKRTIDKRSTIKRREDKIEAERAIKQHSR